MKRLLHVFFVALLLISPGFAQTSSVSCFNDLGAIVQRTGKPTAANALRYAFTPAVVPQNTTQNVLIEVVITGTPSAVNLYLDATQATQPLNDNGTNGDKLASDGVYSAIIAPPTGSWTEPFVGYTRILENNIQVAQINTFIGVLTNNMPLLQPRRIDNSTQFTDYIFNIVVPSTLNTPSDSQKQTLNQLFYKYHPDSFDFINYVLVPGYVGNRFHGNITNTVQGIGLTPFNNTSQYGSKGRLLGYNVFPVPSFFDGASNGYIHEIGHQWINHLSTTFLKDGVPHWPVSNLAVGVMGLSIPGSGAGGQFPYIVTETATGYRFDRASTDAPAFTEWELYLMGLIPASDVKIPAVIFKDQSINTSIATGTVFPKSAFNTYQLSDLVAIAGERIPSAAQSQKQFKSATILLSEQLLSAEEISYFDYMARRAEGQAPVSVREGLTTYMGKPFAVATGNRATVQALLNTNVNCSTVPATPTIASSGSLTICPGSSLTLTAPAGNSLYFWYRNGSPLPQTTASLSTTQTGAYTVSVRNASGCNSLQSAETILIAGTNPPKPTISLTTDGLTSSSVSGNQWLLNGNPIPNATAQTIRSGAGSYAVRVTQNGCTSTSDPFVITAIDEPVPGVAFDLSHMPNPVNESARVMFSLPKSTPLVLRLISLSGVSLKILTTGTYTAGNHALTVPTHDIAAGFYIYRLETSYGTLARKMIVSK
ncbi:choice-of-anchor X domain-containing protein [Spirosoma sp. SC4-14]|uniref:choice-of-anchor X domain-containing protein n=1 Tax=Spirosoma sp. SC4-14 TaxID=3128900 RepID=UPI0030D3D031